MAGELVGIPEYKFQAMMDLIEMTDVCEHGSVRSQLKAVFDLVHGSQLPGQKPGVMELASTKQKVIRSEIA